VTDRIYLRHSTDKQTNARQRHALAPLITAGSPVYEDPATSTRVLSLNRAGFTRLLHEAAVDDTIRIADAARLFRSVGDILTLRPVLIRRGLHLRVESGLLSGIDLASDDPGTKMMTGVLASVLEFQRDMISENTRDGVAAAEVSGKTLGRPAALAAAAADDVVDAYREGAAMKALARQHRVAPKTIRRVLVPLSVPRVPARPSAKLTASTPPASRRPQHPDPAGRRHLSTPRRTHRLQGLPAARILIVVSDSPRTRISYEALGLTPERTGEKFVLGGDNTYGGKVVVNPSGGLLPKGHPFGATGLAQCAELVWQLRGQAESRQVEGARTALQHNIGLGGECVVTLYETRDTQSSLGQL
jgi:DNA invertase Pin-like site-specific DNA recombinase